MKHMFETYKKLLDKNDDEFIYPDQKANVAKTKLAAQDKRLFRYLYGQWSGRQTIEMRLLK